MPEYIFASEPDHYVQAEKLFREYAEWLNIDLSFQDFDIEVKQLSKMYGAPAGCIILVKEEDAYIGCVALRPLKESVAELKRMYVQPEYRNRQIASEMLKKIELFAKETGYSAIRLDTLDSMLPAVNFYRRNGFEETPPYYFNPNKDTIYFEKKL